MLKRLLISLAAMAMVVTPAYGQQLTNEGGKVKQPVTTALPNSVTNEKSSMDVTAVYSPSAGRAWDPLTDTLTTTAVGGGTTVKATAVAPTFVEGSTTNQLSSDLSGGLRISGSVSATSAMKATAADPSYTEGTTTNPISSDLAGYQRSLAKQAGTWNITNVSGTVSLPTGAATSALQTTGNTSLSTIATNTTSIATAANQTSVIGTKAAGTAATNSLLAGGVYNSAGITLTNGQQASLQFDAAGGLKVSGAGGGTQFAEDSVHVSGDLGTVALGIRKDTATALSSADGDYTTSIYDASGRLWVNVGTSALPTGAATSANQGYTAAASGTVATTAGANKAAAIDLFGAQAVIVKNADGTVLDPLTASAVLCGSTVGTAVQCATDAVNGSTGSAVPSKAQYTGANSGGNLVGLIQADTSAKVSISTNTITQIVALSSGKKIYVTNFNLHSAGTTTTKFVYGTGTNCGTGTTDVTDLYDFAANDGIVSGGGLGPVLVIPASQALCISNSAAVHVGGSIAYTQF